MSSINNLANRIYTEIIRPQREKYQRRKYFDKESNDQGGLDKSYSFIFDNQTVKLNKANAEAEHFRITEFFKELGERTQNSSSYFKLDLLTDKVKGGCEFKIFVGDKNIREISDLHNLHGTLVHFKGEGESRAEPVAFSYGKFKHSKLISGIRVDEDSLLTIGSFDKHGKAYGDVAQLSSDGALFIAEIPKSFKGLVHNEPVKSFCYSPGFPVFDGSFKSNQIHSGDFSNFYKIKESGRFHNGFLHGEGSKSFPNGAFTKGHWLAGKPEGVFTLDFPKLPTLTVKISHDWLQSNLSQKDLRTNQNLNFKVKNKNIEYAGQLKFVSDNVSDLLANVYQDDFLITRKLVPTGPAMVMYSSGDSLEFEWGEKLGIKSMQLVTKNGYKFDVMLPESLRSLDLDLRKDDLLSIFANFTGNLQAMKLTRDKVDLSWQQKLPNGDVQQRAQDLRDFLHSQANAMLAEFNKSLENKDFKRLYEYQDFNASKEGEQKILNYKASKQSLKRFDKSLFLFSPEHKVKELGRSNKPVFATIDNGECRFVYKGPVDDGGNPKGNGVLVALYTFAKDEGAALDSPLHQGATLADYSDYRVSVGHFDAFMLNGSGSEFETHDYDGSIDVSISEGSYRRGKSAESVINYFRDGARRLVSERSRKIGKNPILYRQYSGIHNDGAKYLECSLQVPSRMLRKRVKSIGDIAGKLHGENTAIYPENSKIAFANYLYDKGRLDKPAKIVFKNNICLTIPQLNADLNYKKATVLFPTAEYRGSIKEAEYGLLKLSSWYERNNRFLDFDYKPNGFGKLVLAKNYFFEGNWQDGLLQGPATVNLGDLKIKGNFKDGVLVGSVKITNKLANNTLVSGEAVYNDEGLLEIPDANLSRSLRQSQKRLLLQEKLDTKRFVI